MWSACSTNSACIPANGGGRVLGFVRACREPFITTFHTLLAQPDPLPQHLVQSLAAHRRGLSS